MRPGAPYKPAGTRSTRNPIYQETLRQSMSTAGSCRCCSTAAAAAPAAGATAPFSYRCHSCHCLAPSSPSLGCSSSKTAGAALMSADGEETARSGIASIPLHRPLLPLVGTCDGAPPSGARSQARGVSRSLHRQKKRNRFDRPCSLQRWPQALLSLAVGVWMLCSDGARCDKSWKFDVNSKHAALQKAQHEGVGFSSDGEEVGQPGSCWPRAHTVPCTRLCVPHSCIWLDQVPCHTQSPPDSREAVDHVQGLEARA